jgi:hypothetical protein
LTLAFYSDEAEKVLASLTPFERTAVENIRAALEIEPRQGDPRTTYDRAVEEFTVRIGESTTRGRGISVVYRFHRDPMDAVLIMWLIVGP